MKSFTIQEAGCEPYEISVEVEELPGGSCRLATSLPVFGVFALDFSASERSEWSVVAKRIDDAPRTRWRPKLVSALRRVAADHVWGRKLSPQPADTPQAPVERHEVTVQEYAIEGDYLAPYRVEVEVEVLPGGGAILRAHLCDGVLLLAFSPEQRRSWPHVSWEIGQAVDAWYAEVPGGPPHVFTQSGLRYTLQTYAHSRVVLQ